MNNQLKNGFWVLCLVSIFLSGAYFISKYKKSKKPQLPYYGKGITINPNEFQSEVEPYIHKIGKFEFINQHNEPITEQDFKDCIYIANYIFTTCPGICKDMTRELRKIYTHFKSDSSIKILSHTSKPEEDSVSVLYDFSKSQGVSEQNKWHFVTGNIDSLYQMALSSYLIVNPEDEKTNGTFVHTERVALIDQRLHIRGFYDATDPKETGRLIKDIELLKKELQQ
ncbi:MAG: SCO family protein [Cytophagales bacterium]|nr:MAG: SCO family protein [Cytophagales bacterium]